MMSTEEFSQGLGRNLDLFLHFQKTMNETMGSVFTAMNVPTRTDVLALGDRLLAIENGLAALEAQISTALASGLAAGTNSGQAKPRRTRQPAAPPETPHAN